MASTTNDQEAVLRASLVGLLHHNTHGMDRQASRVGKSVQSADFVFTANRTSAVASVPAVVRSTLADFADDYNRTRRSDLWNRLPPEIKLEIVRWLPPGQHVALLGVSRNMRSLVISDTSRWTDISLPDVEYEMDDAERAQFLQTMLPRSGNRPLDLDWVSKCKPGSDAARDAVLDVLPRVRTLVLHSSYFDDYFCGPRTFWTEPSPLLESLTVTDRAAYSGISFDPDGPSKDMPRLREVNVDAVTFYDQPSATPFARVVRLAGKMAYKEDGDCWQHLWSWFPHLEQLVAHIDNESGSAYIPPPPESLRYITLIGGHAAPALLVSEWTAHHVQTLEIRGLTPGCLALRGAVKFLRNCEPGLWTACFDLACCPEDEYPTSLILRGARTAVVIRMHDGADRRELQEASHTVLYDRIETLTLGDAAIDGMLDLCPPPIMPALRTLTVAGTDWMAYNALRPHLSLLHAPGLERLVVDLTDVDDPAAGPRVLSTLLPCIGSPPGVRITLQFDGELEGQISVAPSGGAPFDVELAPLEAQHDDPCFSYRRQR